MGRACYRGFFAAEKVVMKESDVSVHSEMSVNGRLYVIPQDHPDKILVSRSHHSPLPFPPPQTFTLTFHYLSSSNPVP